MAEEPTPEILYYWAECSTEGCRVNGVRGEGIPCLPHPGDGEIYIFCWACNQRITNIGPVETP